MKYAIFLLLLVSMASALEIIQPEDKLYTGDTVPIEIGHDKVLDSIGYDIGEGEVILCEDCQDYEGDLEFLPGSYEFTVIGRLGDNSGDTSVDFDVDFELEATAVRNGNDIDLDIEASRDLDSIEIKDDDYETACEDCDEYSETIDTSKSIIYVRGKLGMSSKEIAVVTESDIGLDIVSPEEEDYEDNDVLFRFTTDHDSDIFYYIDGDIKSACQDCDSFSETVELEDGDHELEVYAFSQNQLDREYVEFSVDEGPLGLRIIQPDENEDETVELDFRTDVKSDITYEIDGEDYDGCEECTRFTDTIDLDPGDYTLKVTAESGSDEETEEIDFTVGAGELNLRIVQPDKKEDEKVELDFRTDVKADITYEIDGDEYDGCEDCTRFTDTIELDEGDYTLKVTAESGDDTQTKTFGFEVAADDDDECYGYQCWQDNYAYWNKLPQMLENGDITDEELAEELSGNKVPPGVINRLIKTGKLEDEAIDVILNEYYNPPGILKKLWGWFGYRQLSYGEQIHDWYDLDEYQERRLLMRDDLPNDKAKKLREKFEQQMEKRMEKAEKKWEQAMKQREKQSKNAQKIREKAQEQREKWLEQFKD